MKKLILISSLAALGGWINHVNAQTGILQGTVKDSAGTPVESANVMIQDIKFATSTDAKGNYRFENVPPGNYSVVTSIVGYKPVANQITIRENESSELNFNLNQKIKELKEVTIIGTSTQGMGHLPQVHQGIIYAGKKTEVLVLDKMDANTAQNNPREVLGRIPGANYSETEGGGFPSNGIAFRGLKPTQSQEIQTRQNGYNIAADLYGYPETYYAPPLEAVERVEVIRGASSLQFGPQFGGIINFIVKDAPKDKPLEVTSQQTLGSYGFTNSLISVGGTNKKLSYYGFVQMKTYKGWRANSKYDQISGFGKIEYKATDKFKVGIEYTIFRNVIQMAGGLTDAKFEQDPSQSNRARNWLNSPWNMFALTSEYKISEKTALILKSVMNVSQREMVWLREANAQMADSISPITNDYAVREAQKRTFTNSTTELRLLTNYNIKGVNQTLAGGVRYFYGAMERFGGGIGSTGSDFDMTTIINSNGRYWSEALDFGTDNAAVFVENIFHIGKRLSVIPGFRYEYLSSSSKGYVTDSKTKAIVNSDLTQYWNIPLFGIGMQMETSKATNVYGNFSETYEPVTYSNLKPFGATGEVDPNLHDVSGYNADIGWRGKIKEFLDFDIALFYMAFNDEIGVVQRLDYLGKPYSFRTNVGNSVHQGVETYIELNPIKTRIGNIGFFNTYSYIDARYTDIDTSASGTGGGVTSGILKGVKSGNKEEMAPEHINRLGVNYSFKAFTTTFLISNLSKSYADANNTEYSSNAVFGVIPAYQVVDWSCRIRIKNYNIRMGISNLTDAKYFTLRTDEYPGPGIMPAMRRSIYVGVGARF